MKPISLFVGGFGLACAFGLALSCSIKGSFGAVDYALIIVGVTFGIFNLGVGMSDGSK